jgi:hypothetical protein
VLEQPFGSKCEEGWFKVSYDSKENIYDSRWERKFTEPADSVYDTNLVKTALRNIPPYDAGYRAGSFKLSV